MKLSISSHNAPNKTAFLFTDVQTPGPIDGIGLARHVKTHWPHIESWSHRADLFRRPLSRMGAIYFKALVMQGGSRDRENSRLPRGRPELAHQSPHCAEIDLGLPRGPIARALRRFSQQICVDPMCRCPICDGFLDEQAPRPMQAALQARSAVWQDPNRRNCQVRASEQSEATPLFIKSGDASARCGVTLPIGSSSCRRPLQLYESVLWIARTMVGVGIAMVGSLPRIPKSVSAGRFAGNSMIAA